MGAGTGTGEGEISMCLVGCIGLNIITVYRDTLGYISLSNHQSVTIAYIDFKSAFDCISHSKLLQKLSCYGVKGNLFLWISAFLSNRSQRVKINSSHSSSRQVTSGVFEGSVLGPVAVQRLHKRHHWSIRYRLYHRQIIWRRHVKLYSSFSNILPNSLQNQFNIIERWSCVWQMRVWLIPNATCSQSVTTRPTTNARSIIRNIDAVKQNRANESRCHNLTPRPPIHPHITMHGQQSHPAQVTVTPAVSCQEVPPTWLRAFKVYVETTSWICIHNLVTIIRHSNHRSGKRPTRLHQTSPRLQPSELRRAPITPQTRKLRTQTVDSRTLYSASTF